MEKQITLESFEGEYARCETPTGEFITLMRSTLPPDAKEGDCLLLCGEGYRIDAALTEERREKNRKILNSLWE